MENRLDIIVFGATGRTGKFTLPEVYKFANSDGRSLTWGIAGRSREKLQEVLTETAKKIGSDLNSIPIILADTKNENSVQDMTACAKVIINCCGPYHYYGEIVVTSCIETGTHYVDISGETQFIELMEMKYNQSAKEKGVYIISACGMESVPADLGLVFLENNFQGCLNSVDVYLHCYEEGGWTSGAFANHAAWTSAVNTLGDFLRWQCVKRNLHSKPLPVLKRKCPLRFPVRRINLDGRGYKWSLPLPATDHDLLKRSQRYFYEYNQKKPAQTNCYVMVDSFTIILKILFFGFFVVLFSLCQCGRNLLLKYPKFFTNGFFSTEEPSDEKMNRMHFSFTLYGEGWNEKLPEGVDHYDVSPNKAIVGQMRGVNPGYGFTCTSVALCAITILTEQKNLPPEGGVYTPAAAFSKTSLIENLQKTGVVYEIISTKDI